MAAPDGDIRSCEPDGPEDFGLLARTSMSVRNLGLHHDSHFFWPAWGLQSLVSQTDADKRAPSHAPINGHVPPQRPITTAPAAIAGTGRPSFNRHPRTSSLPLSSAAGPSVSRPLSRYLCPRGSVLVLAARALSFSSAAFVPRWPTSQRQPTCRRLTVPFRPPTASSPSPIIALYRSPIVSSSAFPPLTGHHTRPLRSALPFGPASSIS